MKSIYQKLGEAVEKLTDQGKFKTYQAASKDCTSAESKLNCAEKILGAKIKESAPTIKHNGAADNGREEFNESADSETLSEADALRAKTDEIMYDAMGLSESDRRKLKNLPPVGVNLTPTQLREYRWSRMMRFSEADSLTLALKVA